MIFNKNSTTKSGRESKLRDMTISKSYFASNKEYGRVKEIDTARYAITVELQSGRLASNGKFIPIKNSWNQMIHDFGQLRPGLLVEITYIGDQDQFPEALVIGLEGEKIAERQQAPEISLGLYEIFTPG